MCYIIIIKRLCRNNYMIITCIFNDVVREEERGFGKMKDLGIITICALIALVICMLIRTKLCQIKGLDYVWYLGQCVEKELEK